MTRPLRRYHYLLTVLVVAIVVMAMSLAPRPQLQSRDGIGRIGEAARGLASTAEQASRSGPVPSSEGAVGRGGSLDSTLPTEPDDGGGISSMSQGWATYCAPTKNRCQGWGNGRLLGAVPSFHYGDEPYAVTVFYGNHHVRVTVVSFCSCGDRAGKPTLIDLSPAAFQRLAPLSVGVLPVTVVDTGTAALPTPPPTDR